jgi:hypothetical protein
MGVINDERMEGRVQAILIVTGLGAHTLEEVLPGAEKLHKQPKPVDKAPSVEEVLESESVDQAQFPPMPASNNLDLPAFLRRERYSGQGTHTG